MDFSVVLCLQGFFHGLGAFLFPVYEVYFCFRATGGVEIAEEFVVVCMAGEGVQCFDAGSYGVHIPQDADFQSAVHDAAPKCVFGAVAHKEYGVIRAADAVFEVVEDAAGLAHAGGGDDDGTFPEVVEFLGFGDGAYHVELFEGEGVSFFEEEVVYFFVEAFRVDAENFRGTYGHGAVYIYLVVGEGSLFIGSVEDV